MIRTFNHALADSRTVTIIGEFRQLHGELHGDTGPRPYLAIPTVRRGFPSANTVKFPLVTGETPPVLFNGSEPPVEVALPAGTPLFTGNRLNESVAHAVRGQLQGDADPASWIPLFHFTWEEGILEPGVLTYGQLRFLGDDCLFIKLDAEPVLAPSDDLTGSVPELVRQAVRKYDRGVNFLANHQGYYERLFPERELEYKFNLEPPVDLWGFIRECHERIGAGEMPGFFAEYGDELQRFDYENTLFEITEPTEEQGYISFGHTAAGKWMVKRKWFTEDTYDRREVVWKNQDLDGDLPAEIRRTHGVEGTLLGTFRRIRYDLNLESSRTGHIYIILADECQVRGGSDAVLSQCEVEYLRTRTYVDCDPGEVAAELEQVRAFAESVLTARKIPFVNTFYSKLSFMRDAARGTAVQK